ncbi:MAG: hypothetical protein HFG61_10690 [Lachnospiraceae bacterium]|nr:hypothetical protein [Lachnospiraceae bacterium]
MDDRIKEAFGQVRAGEELKDKTRAFLAGKAGNGTKRRLASYQPLILASACLVFVAFGGRWLFFTPTAKISIDINPSIELGINRFDRVVVVKAYNDDGKELADSLDIRFLGYGEAVRRIVESDRVTALLSQDEVMAITVMESGGPQSVRILSDMESCAKGHPNTYCYSADSRAVAAAHEHGMSCGKYRAFLEVQKLFPGITPEEIQGMTMRQIQDLTDGMAGDAKGQEAKGEAEDEAGGPPPGHKGHGHHGAGNGHGYGRGGNGKGH